MYWLTLPKSIRPLTRQKRDDEQRRHEADEDVGDDQLAADAPEQVLPRQADEPREEVRETDEQRQRAEAADDLDQRRPARSRLRLTSDASLTEPPMRTARPGPGSHERVQNRVASAGALGDGSPRRAGRRTASPDGSVTTEAQ